MMGQVGPEGANANDDLACMRESDVSYLCARTRNFPSGNIPLSFSFSVVVKWYKGMRCLQQKHDARATTNLQH